MKRFVSINPIILAAALALTTVAGVAAALGVTPKIVRKWRDRFAPFPMTNFQ